MSAPTSWIRADKLAAEAKEVLELGSTRLETTDGDRKFLESLMGPRWKVLGGGVADLVDEHGRLTLTLDSLLQRAWETRAALVADKPSNLNHNMVLELVMASPHVLLTDEDEAVPLFVREEQLYVAGLIGEHRRSEKGKAVICIGSPGIGKSFSLLFLLHMYLRAGMTVVFESVELKCMWVFSGEHKEVRTLNLASVRMIWKNSSRSSTTPALSTCSTQREPLQQPRPRCSRSPPFGL